MKLPVEISASFKILAMHGISVNIVAATPGLSTSIQDIHSVSYSNMKAIKNGAGQIPFKIFYNRLTELVSGIQSLTKFDKNKQLSHGQPTIDRGLPSIL